MAEKKIQRGFATMSKTRLKEVSAKGGRIKSKSPERNKKARKNVCYLVLPQGYMAEII